MTEKIVQLIDKDNNNIYPVAGSLKSGSVTTSTINDGAVTADKIDVLSLLDVFYPIGATYTSYDIDFDPNITWGGTWVENTDYVICAYLKTDGTTIRASKNVASFVRNGKGSFNINLSKPMANLQGIIEASAESDGYGCEIIGTYWNHYSSITVDCSTHSGTQTDPLNWFVVVYGRLAVPEYRTWVRAA